MSWNRIWSLAWSDARLAWKKPLPLVMLTILALLMWGAAAGNVTTSLGGGGDIGGKKSWVNSETSLGFLNLVFLAMIVPFFVSVQCGMSLAADEDRKLDRVLLSTPLSPQEYATGRFLGALLPLLGVLSLYAVLQMLLVEWYPRDNPEVLGPFQLSNYLRPLLIYTLPLVLFTAGAALFLGTLTRQAVLVFAVPTLLVIGGALFLWDYSPAWLPRWIDQLLQWGDPAGVRWFLMRFLKEPRGADYLNTASTVPDGPMLASRVMFALLGLLLVPMSGRLVGRRVRGTSPQIDLASLPASVPAPLAVDGWSPRPLPTSQRCRPGFWETTWAILALELRSLIRSPGIWIFGPLIVMQVATLGAFRLGPFETFVLATPGSLAAGGFNTLTLLLILLILFYSVEGLIREQRHGLSGLVHSSATSTAAILTGKVLANGALAVLIALGAFLGAVLLLLYQWATTGVWFGLQPGVFVLIWGLLLAPTLIVWSAFVTLVYSLTLNRYVTYALCLAALIATGLANQWGYLNWATRWHMWSGVQWSELDRLGLAWSEIRWNRALMLCVATVLVALALRVYPRRIPDARGLADRCSPRPLLRASLPILALSIPALLIAGTMLAAMRRGPDGGPVRRQAKDYWKQNVSTWKDQPVPALDRVTATIDLFPETRKLRVKGEYVLRNRSENPMEALPLSIAPHLAVTSWTVDGVALTPVKPIERQGRPSIENRSGLMVVRAVTPLAPDATSRIGFELEGTFPMGWSKGAAQAGEFVLPSGVVLTSFQGSWLPLIGFNEGVGLEAKDQPEAREYPDQHYQRRVDPEFGPAWGTDVELTITAPQGWTLNSVGEPGPATEENGRQSRTWKTTEPVRFFNIVGGPATLVSTAGQQSTVFHDRGHAFHAAQMAEMLDAAREHYGAWFHPYPWQSLRLTEFPGLSSYAQGFPGNITFSESIGFLAHQSAPGDADTVDFIVAHEAAHQWWGNILTPGKGPGGNVLSEGMANFSAALLIEQVRGPKTRRALLKKFEQEYVQGRNPDRERPLNKVDGSRPGDGTLIYNRGGWVFVMLLEQMGRERMLAGLRDFIERFKRGPDFPLIEDLVETLRTHAEDPAAFDEFVSQWLLGKVLPEFQLDDVQRETDAEGRQVVTGKITNIGTGRVAVDVALEFSEEKPGPGSIATQAGDAAGTAAEKPDPVEAGPEDAKSADETRKPGSMQTVQVGPGETVTWRLTSAEVPKEVVVDPDVKLLQLGRKLAKRAIP
jgi:ABC-type transport system involved in multi-copper enzyme maturation permease subunit